MDGPDLTKLNLEISARDATDEDIDRMTRQLLFELKETRVDSVELVKSGPAPASAKGDPISIGNIALEVLPALLPSVIGLIQAWAARGHGRTVKFKGKIGRDRIEFEGSPEEFQKLLAKLEAGK